MSNNTKKRAGLKLATCGYVVVGPVGLEPTTNGL
jgi:hypothetical protein